LLRIEDLDRERNRPGAAEAALADLAWLGIDWDGPVVRQADDTRALAEACERLERERLAYACVCTRGEVALSAPHGSAGESRYPGTCAGRFASSAEARARAGREVALRLAVRPGTVGFSDALHGAQEFDVAAEVGDFPIRRRDGAFAYQLAVAVDDARMGVTEVVRGADLLPSTARQILVQEALGLARPRWLHVPLVLGEDGQRLAKRHGALALEALRAAGVDPRAAVGWAARSLGLPAPERASAAEIVGAFALERLRREPCRLDAAALAALYAARA
jgi:glutamyl-tRNA synthetase